MAQTFYPITPTEIVPGGANDWETMDASGSVPANATGVILHIECNVSWDRYFGIRKPGSTDDRHSDICARAHFWAMIGVDASRYFEAYVESTTDIDIYVVGYTMAGVTFKTNADDMSLGVEDTWTPIDCSTEAPSAIGLIWEVEGGVSFDQFGLRKNGSSDDRHFDAPLHYCFGAIIGCDASQICEGYIETTDSDFFLVGYITDGCTFNTNADDVSLATADLYINLAALPAGANMGIIEVVTSIEDKYGLREEGQSGGHADIYEDANLHTWAIVKCDANRVIEGQIEDLNVDFFVVGYSTAEEAPAAGIGALYQLHNPFGLNILTTGGR